MESVSNESADRAEKFQYQSLAPESSTRLIEVSSDLSRDGEIQLQLFDSDLSEEYTCLSYRWGQENEGGGPFPILVNDKILHVRRKLRDFLRIARKRYPRRRLWIDAICINQDDLPERNLQVRQMGEIYSGAQEVIAWLGDNPAAAAYIPRINSRIRHPYLHFPPTLFWFVLIMTCPCLPSCIWPPKGQVKTWEFESAIRPYWVRAWVTQEIALAKHVRILVCETDFELDTLEAVDSKENWYQEFFEVGKLYGANIVGRTTEDPTPIILLLVDWWVKECEKDVDRIFSIVSICAEKKDLLPHVDYSLSKEQLLSVILRNSSLTPCLCSARVVIRSMKFDKDLGIDHGAQFFVKMKIPATDAHAYQEKDPKSHSCYPEFSTYFLADQPDGQLFCLYDVCPLMRWHLFMWTDEHGKQQVKAIRDKEVARSRSNAREHARAKRTPEDAVSISLGENGKHVKIQVSSDGDSYAIKFNIGVLLNLPSGIELAFLNPGYGMKDELCDAARQSDGHHAVHFLNIGVDSGTKRDIKEHSPG